MVFSLVSGILSLISALGYAGIVILMAVESAATPLPSEAIVPFAGYLVSTGRFSLFGVALAGAIGSVIGSLFVYVIARYGGRPLVEKYGKYIFIPRRSLTSAEKFFAEHGVSSLLIGRIVPVVRTYISIPAGVAKANFWVFTITCFVGSFFWSLLLAWGGQMLGNDWHLVTPYAKIVSYCIIAILLFLLAYWFLKHVQSGSK